jgi:hypothetical protein
MQYLCYALIIAAILYVLGLGFTLFLLPESLRRYTLIFAPWIGYCYVGLVCWPVFIYGSRIRRQTAIAILIAPILCLIIELFRKRRAKLGRTLMHPPTLGALAIAAAGFIVLSIPIIFWNAGLLTTVSLANNDIAHYAAISRFLMEFSRNSTEGFVGQMSPGLSAPFEWAARTVYFGPFAFVAFIGRLFGLMPHQHESLSAFLLSALGAAVVFPLLHETLKVRISVALLAVAFVAFHPMTQFIALEGFFAQAVGTGLALIIFFINTRLLEKNKADFDVTRLVLLLTVFYCGLLFTYPHMLVFLWFFIGVYSIILAFLERRFRGMIVCAGGNILAILAAAMILPQRVTPFIAIFRTYASNELGWFIPWMAPNYIIGLMYRNPFLDVVGDWRIYLALSTALMATYLFAIGIAYRKGFRRIVAFGLVCIAIYAGCFILALMGRKDGILGGYKSFKLVSFFLPFFGVALVSLAATVKAGPRRLDLAIKSILIIAVIASCVMADWIMLPPSRFLRVEPEYEVLRGLERTQSVTSINVLSDVFWPTMWTAYFLMHKNIHLANTSYYATSELKGEYDLEDKANALPQIVHVKPIEAPPTTTLNARFTLVGPVKRKLRAELGTGWYLGEVGHVWSGKDGKRASIMIHSPDDGVRARLRLTYGLFRHDDRMTLRARGEPLASTVDPQPNGLEQITVPELVFNKGDTEVDIISDLDPIQANPSDPRLLSHTFTSVDIEEL